MEEKNQGMSRRTAIKVGLASVAGLALGATGLFAADELLGSKQKKMKVIAINGSPRKNFNTAALLQQALDGAAQQGAETELVHLYDLQYKGCMSCMACKLKNAITHGLCAYKDALTPVLRKCLEADALIFGSPIYYDNVDGMMRSFLERLMFPIDPYTVNEAGQRNRYLTRTVPVGFIYAMNCPEYMRERFYGPMFKSIEGYVSHIFGSCHPLYSTFTYQYRDYSRYDVNIFREEDKRKWREEHFPKDKQQAFELGELLVKEATEKDV